MEPDVMSKTPSFNGVEEVAKMLEEVLDVDNMAGLQRQLARADAWVGRVSFQYRNAENLLAQLKKQYKLPPGTINPGTKKAYTDMDRGIELASAVRDQQTVVDLLKDQAEILRNRISLGQSLMASQRQEMKSALR